MGLFNFWKSSDKKVVEGNPSADDLDAYVETVAQLLPLRQS